MKTFKLMEQIYFRKVTKINFISYFFIAYKSYGTRCKDYILAKNYLICHRLFN